MPRRRLRTFTLWTGTALSLLIAAAFVVSGQWQYTAQAGKLCVYIGGGSVTVLWDDPLIDPFAFDRHTLGLARWNTLDTDWAVWVEFPLHAVFVAVAIPTLFVWRFGGRKPPKPGNTSGVCPECGAEISVAR